MGEVYAHKDEPLEKRLSLKSGMYHTQERMNRIRVMLGEYDFAAITKSPTGWDF